jgi:hypothetical protein
VTSRQERKSESKCYRHAAGSLLFLLCLGCLAAPLSRAQQVDEQTGIDEGNYNIKQSIEFGYRFTNVNGSQQTYDTMVNLQQGPRLLGFTTEFRSLDHHGTFFDDFYFSNFGYGGDPNDVSQIRINKNKWYAFNGMFRQDQNHWDYSLLANPLNPTPPVPNAPPNFNPIINAPANLLGTSLIGNSPHDFFTRRNMQNYNLTIMPESKIRFRLGYDQNTVYGPGNSTVHVGAEQYLLQNNSFRLQQYRLGFDFRFLLRTTLSYDEIWRNYRNDLSSNDENQQFPPGVGFPPVDLGVTFNPGAKNPCATPVFEPGNIVNPVCKAAYSYFSHGQTRMASPTEKVSLQSTYFKNIDIAGRFSYTAGDLNVNNYQKNFAGLDSSLSNYNETGPISGRHVASFGDFGISWQVNDRISIVDSFHYSSWKEPAQYASSQCSFFSTSLLIPANIFTPTSAPPPATCIPPTNGIPAPFVIHSTSSDADAALNINSNFLKQQDVSNTIEARINFSTKVGAYLGYEYRNRIIADNFSNSISAVFYPNNAARENCALVDPAGTLTQSNLPAGCTLNPDGSIAFSAATAPAPPGLTHIQENHVIFGLWARPSSNLRINVDGNIMVADNAFTRISPLQAQEVRFRANYKAASWINLNGHLNLWYGQNDSENVNGHQHNNSVGFAAQLQPTEKLSLDLGYDYNDISSQILVCFVATGSLPGLPACPDFSSLVEQASPYSSKVNTTFIDLSWTPIKPLTLRGGANLFWVSGSELNLTPQNPVATSVPGPLNSAWYQPFGGFDFRFARRWTGRANWEYYGYHENASTAFQDALVRRNFQGNLVVLSLRYAF